MFLRNNNSLIKSVSEYMCIYVYLPMNPKRRVLYPLGIILDQVIPMHHATQKPQVNQSQELRIDNLIRKDLVLVFPVDKIDIVRIWRSKHMTIE